jgi:acetoacetyl-CoA reductase
MTKRVALVTGGMGGIGTAVCRRLARMNENVVVANCLPEYEKKDEWLAQLRAEGYDNVYAAEGDVSDFDSSAGMVRRIESEIGPVDILVNAAGIVRDNMLKKMSLSDWMAVISTNLNSAFIVTKQVIDGMTERGWGRIVNLSSVNGQRGQFGQTNYSAAKAGLHGFAKALAQEVVRKGVTVNSVSPGYVETDMVKSIRKDVLEKIVAGIPMGRLAHPEEIAALIAFLASEEAGYITGANIAINGGMYMT